MSCSDKKLTTLCKISEDQRTRRSGDISLLHPANMLTANSKLAAIVTLYSDVSLISGVVFSPFMSHFQTFSPSSSAAALDSAFHIKSAPLLLSSVSLSFHSVQILPLYSGINPVWAVLFSSSSSPNWFIALLLLSVIDFDILLPQRKTARPPSRHQIQIKYE